GSCGATEFSFELHTVPVPGIVAGGDHHAASRALVFHRIGNGRRGRVVVSQLHRNTGGGDYLRSHFGCALRSEARVISDDDSVPRVFIFQDVGSDGAGYPAHIVEGKIIGDDASPAIGSELYFLSHIGISVKEQPWRTLSQCLGCM